MPGQPERTRVQFVHGDSAHYAGGRVEIPVVVNAGTISENPFPVGPQVRLDRLSPDLVADRILFAVRIGNDVMIESKQRAA